DHDSTHHGWKIDCCTAESRAPLRRRVYGRDGSSADRLNMSISRPLLASDSGRSSRRPERRLDPVEAIGSAAVRAVRLRKALVGVAAGDAPALIVRVFGGE